MSGTNKEYGDLLKERRKGMEMDRMDYAKKKFEERGIVYIHNENIKALEFAYKGCVIRFFPYTGWASGRTIQDCRGIGNLLKQIYG